MRTISFALVLLFAMASFYACAAEVDRRASASSLPSGPISLEEPLMKAEELPIARDATVEKVAGSCNLIRGQDVGVQISKGHSLKAGDVLELGEKCFVRIAARGQSPIDLTPKNGRFMKLVDLEAAE